MNGGGLFWVLHCIKKWYNEVMFDSTVEHFLKHLRAALLPLSSPLIVQGGLE